MDQATDTPWIGRRLPRAETRRLLAGRGRYVDDFAARGEAGWHGHCSPLADEGVDNAGFE